MSTGSSSSMASSTLSRTARSHPYVNLHSSEVKKRLELLAHVLTSVCV